MKNTFLILITTSFFLLITPLSVYFYFKVNQRPYRDIEFIRKNNYSQFVIEKQPLIQGPYRDRLGPCFGPATPIKGAFGNFRFDFGSDPHNSTIVTFVENSYGEIDYVILKCAEIIHECDCPMNVCEVENDNAVVQPVSSDL